MEPPPSTATCRPSPEDVELVIYRVARRPSPTRCATPGATGGWLALEARTRAAWCWRWRTTAAGSPRGRRGAGASAACASGRARGGDIASVRAERGGRRVRVAVPARGPRRLRPRVLVADDHAMVGAACGSSSRRRPTSRSSPRPVTASRRSRWRRARTTSAVLDVAMPRMTGLQAARELAAPARAAHRDALDARQRAVLLRGAEGGRVGIRPQVRWPSGTSSRRAAPPCEVSPSCTGRRLGPDP